MNTSVSQRDPTEVNSPTDHLRRLATAETPPPAHEWQPVALDLVNEHARMQAERVTMRDELEIARVALHNLDQHRCAACAGWCHISSDWCVDCLAFGVRPEEPRFLRGQADEDRRAHGREVRL